MKIMGTTKMKKNDLQAIYDKVFQEAMMLTVDYDSQKIAATYMAIACRIYKTVLEDDEYDLMMEMIHKTPIKPYKQPTLH
jgi:hypothetical protein